MTEVRTTIVARVVACAAAVVVLAGCASTAGTTPDTGGTTAAGRPTECSVFTDAWATSKTAIDRWVAEGRPQSLPLRQPVIDAGQVSRDGYKQAWGMAGDDVRAVLWGVVVASDKVQEAAVASGYTGAVIPQADTDALTDALWAAQQACVSASSSAS